MKSLRFPSGWSWCLVPVLGLLLLPAGEAHTFDLTCRAVEAEVAPSSHGALTVMTHGVGGLLLPHVHLPDPTNNGLPELPRAPGRTLGFVRVTGTVGERVRATAHPAAKSLRPLLAGVGTQLNQLAERCVSTVTATVNTTSDASSPSRILHLKWETVVPDIEQDAQGSPRLAGLSRYALETQLVMTEHDPVVVGLPAKTGGGLRYVVFSLKTNVPDESGRPRGEELQVATQMQILRIRKGVEPRIDSLAAETFPEGRPTNRWVARHRTAALRAFWARPKHATRSFPCNIVTHQATKGMAKYACHTVAGVTRATLEVEAHVQSDLHSIRLAFVYQEGDITVRRSLWTVDGGILLLPVPLGSRKEHAFLCVSTTLLSGDGCPVWPWASNDIVPIQEIGLRDRLDGIVLPRVSLRDVPLAKALAQIAAQTPALDPSGVGIPVTLPVPPAIKGRKVTLQTVHATPWEVLSVICNSVDLKLDIGREKVVVREFSTMMETNFFSVDALKLRRIGFDLDRWTDSIREAGLEMPLGARASYTPKTERLVFHCHERDHDRLVHLLRKAR